MVGGLPAAAAAAAAAQLQMRRLSEPEDDPGIEIATWMILVLVVAVLTLMICCCTCFVIYKFAPEGKQGPAWEIASKGVRFVGPNRNGDDRRAAVVDETDPDNAYVGGRARLDRQSLAYDPRDPGYARPLGWASDNKQYHAPEHAAAIHAQRRGSEGTGNPNLKLEVKAPYQGVVPADANKR